MSDDVRNSILLVLAVCGFIGGPVSVYVAMKSSLTELKTQVMMLVEEIRDLKTKRDTHSTDIAAIRTEQAKAAVEIQMLKSRVDVLERRQSNDRHPALRRREEDG